MPFAAWLLVMYFTVSLLATFCFAANRTRLKVTGGDVCLAIVTHSIAFWCIVSLAANTR